MDKIGLNNISPIRRVMLLWSYGISVLRYTSVTDKVGAPSPAAYRGSLLAIQKCTKHTFGPISD